MMTIEQIQAERDKASAMLTGLETQAGNLQQALNENHAQRLQCVGAIAAFDRLIGMMAAPVDADKTE